MKYWKMNKTSQMLILLFFVLLGVHLILGYRQFREGASANPVEPWDKYVIEIPKGTTTIIQAKESALGELSDEELEKAVENNSFADTWIEWANAGYIKPNEVLSWKEEIKTIKIPTSVTTIGSYAFVGCTNLRSIEYNNPTVKSIGNSAFDGCFSLETINIPDSVTAIGEYAFRAAGTGMMAFAEKGPGLSGEGKDVIIPSSVTTLGNGAFMMCPLKTITINGNIKSIANQLFRECTALESIKIPESVTTIGQSAFEDCVLLKSIQIPNLVTTIGDWTFHGCSALESITIPDSVTTIGERAFRGCSALVSITIPESVTTIGRSAFEDCTSLELVIIVQTDSIELTEDEKNVIKRRMKDMIGREIDYEVVR